MTIAAPTIRRMAARDVAPASDLLRRGDFGDREAFLAWSVDQPTIGTFVAVVGDYIVGTGVASAHGSSGWVGVIFVAAERRGSGLGRAMTETVIDELERRGCRSQVLIASPFGRPLYERLGFVEVDRQVRFAADGLATDGSAADEPIDPRIRLYAQRDRDAVLALDRDATGEDREAVLDRLLRTETAWVTRDASDRPTGYFLRPPWRGGAVIAPDADDGLALLELRRRLTRRDGKAGAGMLASNTIGRQRLRNAGWTEELANARMVRGEPLDWRPAAIWGQLNGALG